MKSQAEFNWIFIIIAGAIILAFFTGFAFKYKALQEEKISIQLLTSLDNTLTSLKSSPFKTLDKINLPNEISITCNDIIVNEKKFKTNNLLFSQGKLSKEMLVYYRPFKLPFKIADFYLITDSNKRYNLIYDSSTQNYVVSLINDLPDDLQAKFSYSTTEKTNMINIRITNLNDDKLRVNNQELYKNDDLVLAAIFSDEFSCMNEKIKLELNNVIQVYKDKSLTVNKDTCNYVPFLTYLDKLKNDYSYSSSIEGINDNLAAINCPVLY
ncbi:MAG: hypothetical protein AABW56_00980 [Nanoarchaeota archaeon]